jgi:hypothetical protein
MKLTNKDRETLRDILERLEKAEKFINDEDTLICTKKLPHELSYYNKDKEGISPVTKFYGSELMQLKNAIDKLAAFLVIH